MVPDFSARVTRSCASTISARALDWAPRVGLEEGLKHPVAYCEKLLSDHDAPDDLILRTHILRFLTIVTDNYLLIHRESQWSASELTLPVIYQVLLSTLAKQTRPKSYLRGHHRPTELSSGFGLKKIPVQVFLSGNPDGASIVQ